MSNSQQNHPPFHGDMMRWQKQEFPPQRTSVHPREETQQGHWARERYAHHTSTPLLRRKFAREVLSPKHRTIRRICQEPSVPLWEHTYHAWNVFSSLGDGGRERVPVWIVKKKNFYSERRHTFVKTCGRTTGLQSFLTCRFLVWSYDTGASPCREANKVMWAGMQAVLTWQSLALESWCPSSSVLPLYHCWSVDPELMV